MQRSPCIQTFPLDRRLASIGVAERLASAHSSHGFSGFSMYSDTTGAKILRTLVIGVGASGFLAILEIGKAMIG
jgi:hypothetical protein